MELKCPWFISLVFVFVVLVLLLPFLQLAKPITPHVSSTNREASVQQPLKSFNSKEQLKTPVAAVSCRNSSNILVIYTGRWKFLRVQLPHVYRELRSNGGVLDQVWFVLIRFDDTTMTKIKNFVEVANRAQKIQVFSIHDQGFKLGDFTHPYYEIFNHLIRYPYDRFFKFDDDIVYIHPRAFNYILQHKDESRCFMHFFNIAGSNWRCSWLHQKNGVYNETNPGNLHFQYHPNGDCGWKSTDCGELTIRTFLHHYNQNQLHRYYFTDLELTTDRKRHSIDAFMLDKDLINIPAMMKVGKIHGDDEEWWTVTYSAIVPHPNCIVGDALVVHFAYNTVVKKLLALGLLEEFVKIVIESRSTINMEETVWQALDF